MRGFALRVLAQDFGVELAWELDSRYARLDVAGNPAQVTARDANTNVDVPRRALAFDQVGDETTRTEAMSPTRTWLPLGASIVRSCRLLRL